MEEASITDVLCEETIDISDSFVADKADLFRNAASIFMKAGFITNEEKYIKALYEREAEGPTYMGDEMAVPHGRSDAVIKPGIVLCRTRPFMYESYGEKGNVRLSIVLAVPGTTDSNTYMKMLSSIMRLLMCDRFRETLLNSCDKKEIIKVGQEEYEALPKF